MLMQLCWQPCSCPMHMSTPARQNRHQNSPWADSQGPQLCHVPCPCSQIHRNDPHSASPPSPRVHPLISRAQTWTLCGVGFRATLAF